MRVLLLSAYDASSHRRWRERLMAMFPGFHWQQLCLPPRHFSWRIRGNSLQWATTRRDELTRPYDLLLATSMVDLAALRGLVPALTQLPTVVYFHENQFAFPTSPHARDNVEPKLVPLYSALCADRIVFNSAYNKSTFLAGATELLNSLPDRLPATLLQQLERATVIPVPLLRPRPAAAHAPGECLEVLWNHRWEYDKGVDLLLALVRQLTRQRQPIRLHLAGECFQQVPAQFDSICSLLSEWANQMGLQPGNVGFVADAADYAALLARCDVVLSTALHEFQGLALQEASLAGCSPLAPADLVYPEFLDSRFLYSRQADHEGTARAVLSRLQAWQLDKAAGRPLPRADLDAYLAENLQDAYRDLFTELAGGRGD